MLTMGLSPHVYNEVGEAVWLEFLPTIQCVLGPSQKVSNSEQQSQYTTKGTEQFMSWSDYRARAGIINSDECCQRILLIMRCIGSE